MGHIAMRCRAMLSGYDLLVNGADWERWTTRSSQMTKVTTDMSMSLDGYVAGANQTAEKPFGDGDVDRLHQWMFEQPDLPENAAALERFKAGAHIMGRNMFGPIRGEWDGDWKGWWGDEPPFHAPVFVLTHHEREPVVMEGGTTFHFVTDGIESALEQARAASADGSVAISGGAATVNQYLAAGLIDELRVHIVPVVLDQGERLFEGVGQLTLEPLEITSNELVTHQRYRVLR
jgi:dihydrofolate reductase